MYFRTTIDVVCEAVDIFEAIEKVKGRASEVSHSLATNNPIHATDEKEWPHYHFKIQEIQEHDLIK
jgi:hypothetical protein